MTTTSVSNILDQHLEEAAFLAEQRVYASCAPHYDLEHLAALEQRLEAHIDGLRIAGKTALEQLIGQLHPAASGELFTCAVLLLEQADLQGCAQLLRDYGQNPQAEQAFSQALGWLEWRTIEPVVTRMVHSRDPLARCLGLAAYRQHRQHPGSALSEALEQTDARILEQAARCAGALRCTDLRNHLRQHQQHPDAAVRFWCNWACAQMGDEEALNTLRTFAENTSQWQLDVLPVLLTWQAREFSMAWIRTLTQTPQQHRLAIQAAGLFGDPATIEWLIRQMSEPAYARAAGAAFSLISGADLALLDLEQEHSPDYDAGPNDDPQDPNVVMDPDTDLAWPDPSKVAIWWQQHAENFQLGQAYLLGQPWSPASCLAALNHAWQNQRIAAAYLLARYHPSQMLFPARAPVTQQRRWLSKFAAAEN